ncbi:MAG: hypothetical protein KBC64_06110 [Simkaniaceae bacterium]|nr:hypothetical protein [Simkaniaceae bacterium]
MAIQEILHQVQEWIFGPTMATLALRVQDNSLSLAERVENLYRMVTKGRIYIPAHKALVITSYNSLPQANRNELDHAVYKYAHTEYFEWPGVYPSTYESSHELNKDSPTFGHDQMMYNPFVRAVQEALYDKSGLAYQGKEGGRMDWIQQCVASMVAHLGLA